MSVLQEFNLKTFTLTGINLIEASAGTGKTFTISSLYLRLVLEQAVPVAKILVVTFTKAATAELKERLRQRLLQAQAVLGGFEQPDPVLHLLLQGALQHLTLSMDAEKAKQTLQLRLEQALLAFDDASIFTIHGFCQKLLKNNALLTGQAFDGKILPDALELARKTTLSYWRQTLLKRPQWARALQRQNFLPEHRIWKTVINYALNDKDTPVTWPSFSELTEQDVADIQALLGSDDFEQYCQQVHHWQELGAFKATTSIGKHPQLFDQAIELWRQAKAKTLLPVAAKSIVIEPSTLKAKFVKDALLPDFLIQFEDWYEKALSSSDAVISLAAMQEFYRQAPALYAQELEQSEGISYDDLLRGVDLALAGGTNLDLVRAVQEQYQAALIDEFQDTDAIQYEIFKTLFMQEGLSQHAPFVCFVGDPKQAIYHFRGADLKTYLNAREDIENSPNGHCFTLTHNYRSNSLVLDAVNALFASADAFKNPRIVYQPVKCGNLNKALVQQQGHDTAALAVSVIQADNMKALRDASQALTAKKILELIDPREGFTIDQRPVCAGDIAILLRRNDEIAQMQKFLRAYGIESKVVTNENIFASTDAQEVRAILRAALMPTNLRLIKAALSTRMMGLDGFEVATIGQDETEGADAAHNAYTWIEKFKEYKRQWQSKGAGYLINAITQESHYAQRVLKNVDAARRLANLDHLCEILYDMSARYRRAEAMFEHFNASETLGQEDIDANALRLESDENMVTILSLHRSKGLEFPIVLLPMAYAMGLNKPSKDRLQDCEINGHKSIVALTGENELDADYKKHLIDEADQEVLRLFYVAATRASSRLEIFDTDYKRVGSKVTEHLLGAAAWQYLQQTLGSALSVQHYSDAVSGLMRARKQAPKEQVWPNLATPARKAAWEVTSYSGLVSSLVNEREHVDDILVSTQNNALALQWLQAQGAPSNDILFFPRGAEAGEALHEVLEKVDFTDSTGWDDTIRGVLQRYFPNSEDFALKHAQVRQMLDSVIGCDLGLGWSLSQILFSHRISEMQFWLTMQRADSAYRVIAAIDRKKRPGCQLGHLLRESENDVQSFLKGFIDLVFEHEGRYYIVDWKSNFLSGADLSQCDDVSAFIANNYNQEALQEAINQHSYGLQYLLYCVALHRLLKLRLGSAYSYEEHMGGVFYLFLRGVRAGGQANQARCGVWYDRPEAQLIQELDALLGTYHG